MPFACVVSRAAAPHAASRLVHALAVSGLVCAAVIAGTSRVAAAEGVQTDNTMDAVTVTGQRAEPRHVMGTREYILMLENLGDLHTRMAAQVYGEATQLDATRPSLASKLALVDPLLAEPQHQQIQPLLISMQSLSTNKKASIVFSSLATPYLIIKYIISITNRSSTHKWENVLFIF